MKFKYYLKRLTQYGNNMKLLMPAILKQYFSLASVMVKGIIIVQDIIIKFLVLHIAGSVCIIVLFVS